MGCTIRQRRLAVACLLLLSAVARAADPVPGGHTFCGGLVCTESRRVRSEIAVADEGDPEIPVYTGKDCPRGLPVEGSLTSLPRGHAFIGADKKQVIIDLKNPERDLRDGDILLSSYNPLSEDASTAARFFDGSGHAALIGTVNGHKFHLDSPWQKSGRCDDPSFKRRGSTVLRLREFPPGIDTTDALAKLKKEHPEKLEQWQTYRRDVLERVNQYFQAMRRSPFDYHSDYLNMKVFDKPTREAWRAQLFPKQGKASCPVKAVFCSELPATGYALADEEIAGKLPRGLSILNSLNAFEATTLKGELKKERLDSAAGKQAFDRAWLKLVQDVGEGQPVLVEEFQRQSAKIKDATYQLLKLPRELRPAAFALLTSNVSLPVSPTDLFNDIFRPNGLFSYVGTYVGEHCHPTQKIAALGQPNEGQTRLVPKEKKIVSQAPSPPVVASPAALESMREPLRELGRATVGRFLPPPARPFNPFRGDYGEYGTEENWRRAQFRKLMEIDEKELSR